MAEALYEKQNAGLLLMYVALCCVRHEIVQILFMQVPEKVFDLLGVFAGYLGRGSSIIIEIIRFFSSL